MSEAQSVRKAVRDFILENYLFTDDQSELGDDASFLQEGIIDSTGILEVIAFIEDEYGINVEDAELIPENLDSVDNLTAFIVGKTGSQKD
ncbi:MAG: acyl carrier protein [Deltaproteobacteria bacterium]|nr:acyl carrier protein [Deltaproteobacteria bacterium]